MFMIQDFVYSGLQKYANSTVKFHFTLASIFITSCKHTSLMDTELLQNKKQ